jgi:hypothetical protein
MRVPRSIGSPSRIARAFSTIASTKRSWIACSTRIRDPAEHTSPWFTNTPNTAPSIAGSQTASAKKMLGDLPPSSSVTRLRFESAAARRMLRPVRVEPVNATLSTRSLPASIAPTSGPSPVTTLTTPFGRSGTASRMRARWIAVTGVASAGLSTTVHPAHSAGAIFHAAISSG